MRWTLTQRGLGLMSTQNRMAAGLTLNVDTKELAKRARYYQALMDIDTLKRGEPYSSLPESYVLFLCLDDIFGCGLPVYSFQNVCTNDSRIKMNDGTYKIFLMQKNMI